jgi:hypothetical protein
MLENVFRCFKYISHLMQIYNGAGRRDYALWRRLPSHGDGKRARSEDGAREQRLEEIMAAKGGRRFQWRVSGR